MKKALLYIGIISLTILSSCKKSDKIEGPELVDLFGEFKVLEPLKASISNPNFATGDIVNYHTKLSITN
jgi:hypothetical protein